MKLRNSDITNLVGTLASILITVFYIRLGSGSIFGQKISPDAEAMFLLIILLIISQIVSSFIASHEIHGHIDSASRRLRITVPPIAPLSKLGKVERSFPHLEQMAAQAHMIKNTFVSTLGENQRNILNDYSAHSNPIIISIMHEGMRENCSWVDIFSSQSSERIKAIKDSIDNGRILKSKYSAFRLKADFPIINFIIIETDNGKEILFGFGLHQNEGEGKVFASSDQELVNMFDNYYKTLVEHYSVHVDI